MDKTRDKSMGDSTKVYKRICVCGASLATPRAVTITLQFPNVRHEFDAATGIRMIPPSRLVDVDDLIANGYLVGAYCVKCEKPLRVV